ncbi:MAG: F0F1 ATP synthase subunit B' [Alkalinema sp. RL_2_19]|nr:F0F1 ATP synthase subunit B' [Alkalinema sp. RL_2_19]
MFDFDATLPLMAVQFMLLVVLLNAVFFKPLTKVLEERAELISRSKLGAKDSLAQIEAITAQYEQELAASRREYQAILDRAKAEAQKIADEEVAAAQAEAVAQREQAQQELDQQKAAAMSTLQQQVGSLSSEILNKILVGV